MSNLVYFDRQGAFGPGLALIYNSPYYNEDGLTKIAELLKQNFMALAKIKPIGKKEFCASVSQRAYTPAEIVGTRFFQSMRKPEATSYHQQVLEFAVPHLLNPAIEAQFPDADVCPEVKEWVAYLLESYLPKEQLTKRWETQ